MSYNQYGQQQTYPAQGQGQGGQGYQQNPQSYSQQQNPYGQQNPQAPQQNPYAPPNAYGQQNPARPQAPPQQQYGGGPPSAPAGQPNPREIFGRVDRDRSGKINVTELQSALSNGTWKPFNPETCRLMIGMFDRDGDGQIDVTEFEQLWKYVTDWTTCFQGFDRDRSGNIDKAELTQALTQFGYRLNPIFINTLMKKFDRTGTGSVNFDDFIQLAVVLQTLTAAFRDKDTDRDGVITVGYEDFLTMVFSLKI